MVVSFIGLETQEVAIKPNVKVVLSSDSQALEEVMVVAYGTAKKSSFTGSAGTMNADKIATRSVSNITNAMSGQVAGVQMTSDNGQPGESAKIRIRGIGSMASSNDPLYVVDGVPYDGDISSINPSDIESLTVLKDAAANAIYGARGANGVVLITTKSGQNGEARVTFDAKWGSNSRAVPNYDVISNPVNITKQCSKLCIIQKLMQARQQQMLMLMPTIHCLMRKTVVLAIKYTLYPEERT